MVVDLALIADQQLDGGRWRRRVGLRLLVDLRSAPAVECAARCTCVWCLTWCLLRASGSIAAVGAGAQANSRCWISYRRNPRLVATRAAPADDCRSSADRRPAARSRPPAPAHLPAAGRRSLIGAGGGLGCRARHLRLVVDLVLIVD